MEETTPGTSLVLLHPGCPPEESLFDFFNFDDGTVKPFGEDGEKKKEGWRIYGEVCERDNAYLEPWGFGGRKIAECVRLGCPR